ncbi:helix-turn-helix transcriptional regulator [bacterium]|nr:helix-turn-helix transcriptional regulator [bacterium]
MKAFAESQVGNTIALLRRDKGLTQAELAEKLEVTQSVVARWEKNQVQPRTKALEKIAQALEIPLTSLLSGGYSKVAIRLSEVDDPELADLLGQVDKLNERERDALKVFMRAILQQIQIGSLVKR